MKDNLASTVPDVDELAASEESTATSGNSTNEKVSYDAMANHPDVKAAFNERTLHSYSSLAFFFLGLHSLFSFVLHFLHFPSVIR
jgi:hypothetical protein